MTNAQPHAPNNNTPSGIFDTSDPNPHKWKKKGVIKDPLWKGAVRKQLLVSWTGAV